MALTKKYYVKVDKSIHFIQYLILHNAQRIAKG